MPFALRVCTALPVLRRIKTSQALLTAPGGELLAILGVGISLVLITRLDLSGLFILAGVTAIARKLALGAPAW